MLLIEEFLDNCYQIAKKIEETSLNELIEYIEDNFDKIDDPLLLDNEIKQKLSEFTEYILSSKNYLSKEP